MDGGAFATRELFDGLSDQPSAAAARTSARLAAERGLGFRAMLRRRSRLIVLVGAAMASASVVLLWRATMLQDAISAAGPIFHADPELHGRAAAAGEQARDPALAGSHRLSAQELLRNVDRAASAAGVRIASATVRTPRDRGESLMQPRLQVQLSGTGRYKATKDLIERLLQSEPSLAMDRLSVARALNASGELDVQVSFHTVDLEMR